jgi:eukaryotic-like serine/threonine-protein kinase
VIPVSQSRVAGRYRLVEQLGSGGMGTVWRARDEVLQRDVAIKEVVPNPGLTEEERQELRLRTVREARTAARLTDPHVVRIYDVVHTDDRPWIVMEYVPSRSLDQVMTEDEPLAPERVARIGLAVLAALKAAHAAGVLHRDVKPGNVLLADDGRVVLTDFGLAIFDGGDGTLTRPGLVLGSAQYISPERARDGSSGPEGDLWSLGATLYAAVEGRSPYARTTTFSTLTALATVAPDPPRRAGSLEPVLNALLCKDPQARASVAETERLLRQAATGEGPAGPRPGHTAAVVSPESARSATVDPASGDGDAGSASETGPGRLASPASVGDEPLARAPRGRRVAVLAAVAVVLVAAALLVDLIASGSPGRDAGSRTPADVPTLGARSPAAASTLDTPASATASPSASEVKRGSGSSPAPSVTAARNLAAHRPTAESSHTQIYSSGNAVDGDANSYWESASQALPQWVQVDLGTSTAINRIVLKLPPLPAWGTRTQTLSVLGSVNGSSFTIIVGSAYYTFDWATGNTVTIRLASTSTRYVRVNVTSTSGWPAAQVSEIEIYAS